MKHAHKLLVLVALALALFTIVPGALAYFTASTNGIAKTKPLELTEETHIDEKVEGWKKSGSIYNEEDSIPVYVRIRAYALDSDVKVSYAGDAWYDKGDGWFYYKGILQPKENTPEFTVEVTSRPMPTDTDLEFDVTFVYETLPVQYNENGAALNAWEAEWAPELIIVSPEQGA